MNPRKGQAGSVKVGVTTEYTTMLKTRVSATFTSRSRREEAA